MLRRQPHQSGDLLAASNFRTLTDGALLNHVVLALALVGVLALLKLCAKYMGLTLRASLNRRGTHLYETIHNLSIISLPSLPTALFLSGDAS